MKNNQQENLEETKRVGEITHTPKVWHLAESDLEEKLSNSEFIIWRMFYGFLRWQKVCQSCVNDDDVAAEEIALIHLIRMCDRPKNIYEIASLMNRDYSRALTYSLEKLVKLRVIKKSKKKSEKIVYFEITDRGKDIAEKYGIIRRGILYKMLKKMKVEDIEKVSEIMTDYKNMYDEASRLASLLKID